MCQGAAGAAEFLRTPQRGGHAAALTRAIGELRRIAKSLYLLAYLDDEAYLRRVLTQLNRGEVRHSLARAVFHGQKGELRQRYREGQEDQLGARGLVVNLLVLWTTRYMDLAVAHLRREGGVVRVGDAARLSPLGYAHVNPLGRYHFALSGSGRPGRHPAPARSTGTRRRSGGGPAVADLARQGSLSAAHGHAPPPRDTHRAYRGFLFRCWSRAGPFVDASPDPRWHATCCSKGQWNPDPTAPLVPS